MVSHDVADPSDEPDSLVAGVHQFVQGVQNGLLQIRLHRIEQARRGIDVDEHSMRKDRVQTLQHVPFERRRTY